MTSEERQQIQKIVMQLETNAKECDLAYTKTEKAFDRWAVSKHGKRPTGAYNTLPVAVIFMRNAANHLKAILEDLPEWTAIEQAKEASDFFDAWKDSYFQIYPELEDLPFQQIVDIYWECSNTGMEATPEGREEMQK